MPPESEVQQGLRSVGGGVGEVAHQVGVGVGAAPEGDAQQRADQASAPIGPNDEAGLNSRLGSVFQRGDGDAFFRLGQSPDRDAAPERLAGPAPPAGLPAAARCRAAAAPARRDSAARRLRNSAHRPRRAARAERRCERGCPLAPPIAPPRCAQTAPARAGAGPPPASGGWARRGPPESGSSGRAGPAGSPETIPPGRRPRSARQASGRVPGVR